jgi:signal transduction histidine kinase
MDCAQTERVEEAAPPRAAASIRLADMVAGLEWFMRLRWLSVAGVILLPLGAWWLLGYQLPVVKLAAVGIGIAAYNVLFGVWLRAYRERMTEALAALMANVQMAVDLTALTAVLHLSGGVGNPLAGYYVFHIIIAAPLLTPLASYAQATWAVALYSAMVAAEAKGWLVHYPLPGLVEPDLYRRPQAWLFVTAWASTLYIAAYLVGYLAQRLHQREIELEGSRREAELRAGQCEVAYERLMEMQRAQVQYLRRVSHELKAPLAAIATSLSVVLEGLAGEVGPEVRELLERAHRRAHEAADMVGDLLDLARVRQLPAQQFEPVDVGHLVETVVDMYAEQAARKGLRLEVSAPGPLPPVGGDREALETLLSNLVSNAVKYTPEGGQVTVSAEQAGEQVVLRVRDTGPGIAEEELPRLFQEFYRSPSVRQAGIEGTGLGLAIVKSIVERHRGSVEVVSRPGAGATFIVRLPIAAPEQAPGHSAE